MILNSVLSLLKVHIRLLTVYLGHVELGQGEGSALIFKFLHFCIL